MQQLVAVGSRIVLSLVVAAAATSCAQSPKSIVEKSRPALTAKLGKLDAIAGAAASVQKPGSDTLTLPPGAPPLELGGVCYGSGLEPFPPFYQRSCNAQLFAIQELQKPLDDNSEGANLFGARELVWRLVKNMVVNGKYPKDKKDAVKALQAFPQWRYVVVLSFDSAQWPQTGATLGGGYVNDKESYDRRSFTPGTAAGKALLFDLEDGKLLGGFPFAASSSASIESTSYGGDPQKAMQRALERDFLAQIRKAVGEGLVKRLPANMTSKQTKDS